MAATAFSTSTSGGWRSVDPQRTLTTTDEDSLFYISFFLLRDCVLWGPERLLACCQLFEQHRHPLDDLVHYPLSLLHVCLGRVSDRSGLAQELERREGCLNLGPSGHKIEFDKLRVAHWFGSSGSAHQDSLAEGRCNRRLRFTRVKYETEILLDKVTTQFPPIHHRDLGTRLLVEFLHGCADRREISAMAVYYHDFPYPMIGQTPADVLHDPAESLVAQSNRPGKSHVMPRDAVG